MPPASAFEMVTPELALLPGGQAIAYRELSETDPIRVAAEAQYARETGAPPPTRAPSAAFPTPPPGTPAVPSVGGLDAEDIAAVQNAPPEALALLGIGGMPATTPTLAQPGVFSATAPVTAPPLSELTRGAAAPAPVGADVALAQRPAAAPFAPARQRMTVEEAIEPGAPEAPAHAAAPPGGPAPAETASTRVRRAFEEREALTRQAGEARARVAESEADVRANLDKDLLAAQQERDRAAADAQQGAREAMRTFRETRAKFENARTDPDRYWHRMDTGQRILTGIAMGLDVLGAGLRGGQPILVPLVRAAIEDDIAAQRDDAARLGASAEFAANEYQMYERALGSAEAAEQATRASALERAENEIARRAADILGADAGAAATAEAIGELRTERERLLAEIERHGAHRAMTDYQAASAAARLMEIAIAKERAAAAAQREGRMREALQLRRESFEASERAQAFRESAGGRAEERTATRDIVSDKQNIARVWQQENLAAMIPAAREVESIMQEYGQQVPPGLGVTAQAFRALPLGDQIVRTLQSPEATRVRGAIANLANQILRAQSGAAVTDPEFKRFLEAVAGQSALSAAEYAYGVPRMLNQVRSSRALAASAGTPEALRLFEAEMEAYENAPIGGRLSEMGGEPARAPRRPARRAPAGPSRTPAPAEEPAHEMPGASPRSAFPPGFEE